MDDSWASLGYVFMGCAVGMLMADRWHGKEHDRIISLIADMSTALKGSAEAMHVLRAELDQLGARVQLLEMKQKKPGRTAGSSTTSPP